MTKNTDQKITEMKNDKTGIDELWDVQAELESYSFLLRWNNHDESQALHGLGLSLGRLSERIGKLAESFNKSLP